VLETCSLVGTKTVTEWILRNVVHQLFNTLHNILCKSKVNLTQYSIQPFNIKSRRSIILCNNYTAHYCWPSMVPYTIVARWSQYRVKESTPHDFPHYTTYYPPIHTWVSWLSDKKSVCNSYIHVPARVTALLKSANNEASLMHFSPASRSDPNILQSTLFSNTHDLLLYTPEDSILPGC